MRFCLDSLGCMRDKPRHYLDSRKRQSQWRIRLRAGVEQLLIPRRGNKRNGIRGYIGPCPPDKDHCYTLTVYALDCEMNLQPGFYFNEFHWALQGHILDSVELNILSRA